MYRYTDHLMAYESLPPQWDHIDPHLLPITTPLHVGIWEQCLASHLDKQFAQYIVQGLHKGFQPGPFTPGELNTPIHISPIGVIPKIHQPNKWRLIVDMSSPDGFSINDGINTELSSLTYIKMSSSKFFNWAQVQNLPKLTLKVPTVSSQSTQLIATCWAWRGTGRLT